ncbi:MAG: CHAT domain-containing protein [Acidobacteriota bacterium]|nr:CHAT domain-containing protein [Acidobacteriota bacterium]
MRRDRRILCAAAFATALFAASGSHTSVEAQSEARQTPQATGTKVSESIRKLIKEGRYRDAEAAARVLVERVEATSGRDSLEAAAALDLLVEALWQGGKSTGAESRELAERAVAIKERELGKADPALAVSLFHLAAFRSNAEAYADAKPLFERVLAIREKALGPDHPDVAFTLNVFGSSRLGAGDYVEAKRLLERGLEIRERTLGPEHLDVAGSLNNLATLLFRMNDSAGAKSLLERAVAIWEKTLGPLHPRVGLGVSNLATMHKVLGDDAGAKRLFERALGIQEKTLGPEHPSVALTLSNLANALAETGEPAAARPLYERSLAIREKVFGPEHSEVAAVLINLGSLSKDLGDYAAARPLYQRAVAMTEKTHGPDHPLVAEFLLHWAALLAETGETSNAVTVAVRADSIGREQLRLSLRTLAEREALAYASGRHSGLGLALTLSAEGTEKAAGSQRPVWDAVVRSRSLVLDEMAARHRTISGSEDPEIGLAARNLTSAREALARLLVSGPSSGSPEQYRDRIEQARRAKEKAERALAEKSAAFRTEQGRAKLGLDEVAAALPADGALLAFALYGRQQLGPRQPHTKGKEPEPIPSYLAFVLKGSGEKPTVVPLGTAKEIDSLVSRWREQIGQEAGAPGRAPKRSEAAHREAGIALRKKIWQPLEPHVAGARRVFVVPDGSLHFVNLAALPVGRDRYLIESGPMMHYLSAERDLVPREPTRKGEGLLAVGAPAFDESRLFAALAPRSERLTSAAVPAGPADASGASTYRGPRSACGSFTSMSFEPLPAAGRETEEIATLWNAAEDPRSAPARKNVALVLTGAAASEAAVKKQARGSRILHLATHGFFLGGRCASALDASGRQPGAPPPAAVGENPLRLAGLALAGANRRASAGADEEDGILTAEEIAALDLDGVDWAVLSACDTGIGEVKASEGVFGLRRAFQVAGARTVLMSLWQVEDAATRAWMTTVYRGRLTRKLSTVEAVHEASLEVLRQRRSQRQSTHPFYWAGFVAVGDWR